MTNTSNVIATGAVLTPFWFPTLQQWSEIAAFALPILGVIWLVVQIVGYVLDKFKRK